MKSRGWEVGLVSKERGGVEFNSNTNAACGRVGQDFRITSLIFKKNIRSRLHIHATLFLPTAYSRNSRDSYEVILLYRNINRILNSEF